MVWYYTGFVFDLQKWVEAGKQLKKQFKGETHSNGKFIPHVFNYTMLFVNLILFVTSGVRFDRPVCL